LLLFFGNLLGFGLGPWATGWLSDLFSASHGATGLRYALMIIMALVLPSGLITLAAARHIIADTED
jgi:MFS family permease